MTQEREKDTVGEWPPAGRKRTSITGGRGGLGQEPGAFHLQENEGQTRESTDAACQWTDGVVRIHREPLSETESENGEQIWIVLYEWEWLNQGNTVQCPHFSESYWSPISSETISCPAATAVWAQAQNTEQWASPGLRFSQLWQGVIYVSATGLQCPDFWPNIILNVSERVLGWGWVEISI